MTNNYNESYYCLFWQIPLLTLIYHWLHIISNELSKIKKLAQYMKCMPELCRRDRVHHLLFSLFAGIYEQVNFIQKRHNLHHCTMVLATLTVELSSINIPVTRLH